MELCCATPRALSSLPRHSGFSNPDPNPNPSSLPLPRTATAFPSKKTPLSHSKPGLRYSGIPLLRASYFEDSSTGTVIGKFGTVPDEEVTAVVKDESPNETVSATKEESPYEADGPSRTEEAPGGEQSEVMDFLNKLDIKLDTEDTYSILIYGTGALLALWISSAIVGALDSLPLFPKLMEIVGLGYTVWFSYRYLIFKRNRDELFAKIENLKEQIIGRADD